ncbi:unnamed protein product [Schistosoma spindalis]|nr:unnamed protein product [Schistosoma spindale]
MFTSLHDSKLQRILSPFGLNQSFGSYEPSPYASQYLSFIHIIHHLMNTFTLQKLSFVILTTFYLSLPWIISIVNTLPTANNNDPNILYRLTPSSVSSAGASASLSHQNGGGERIYLPEELLAQISNEPYINSLYLPKRAAYMDLPWGKRALAKRAAYIDLPWG